MKIQMKVKMNSRGRKQKEQSMPKAYATRSSVYKEKQMEVKEMRRKLRELEAEVKAAESSWILDHVGFNDPASYQR